MKEKFIWYAVIISIILRAGFVFLRPNWQAPDEFPHFYYAAHIAAHEKLPQFMAVHPYYESFQPPLYYFIASILIKTVGIAADRNIDSIEDYEHISGFFPELVIVRFFSLLLGIAAIIIAVPVLKKSLPGKPYGTYTCILLLFHPAFMSNTTSVTNDALAVLIGTVLLYFMVENYPVRRPVISGIVLSLALLTKTNLLLFMPIFLVMVIIAEIPFKQKLLRVCFMLAPVLMIVGFFVAPAWKLYAKMWLFPPSFGYNETVTFARFYEVLRNFFWSFWVAFGRAYEIHLPALLYLVVFFPVSIASIFGIGKSLKRCSVICPDRELTLKFVLVSTIFIIASLHYSLFFFGGVNTSWGKNIFPALPAVLALFVGGLYKIMENRTKILILVLSVICFLIDVWALSLHTGLLEQQ